MCLALIIIPSLGSGPAQSAAAQSPEVPRTLPSASPTPEATPTPTPTPTPEPTPTPVPALDFTQPVPESEEVEMDYFSDALFIGDSRTDGLRLYSGIQGADFYCYKGLTIFEVDERKIVELNGSTYSVVEALEKGPQYAKIYISLGVNELGYYNDDAYHQAFSEFLDTVKDPPARRHHLPGKPGAGEPPEVRRVQAALLREQRPGGRLQRHLSPAGGGAPGGPAGRGLRPQR